MEDIVRQLPLGRSRGESPHSLLVRRRTALQVGVMIRCYVDSSYAAGGFTTLGIGQTQRVAWIDESVPAALIPRTAHVWRRRERPAKPSSFGRSMKSPLSLTAALVLCGTGLPRRAIRGSAHSAHPRGRRASTGGCLSRLRYSSRVLLAQGKRRFLTADQSNLCARPVDATRPPGGAL